MTNTSWTASSQSAADTPYRRTTWRTKSRVARYASTNASCREPDSGSACALLAPSPRAPLFRSVESYLAPCRWIRRTGNRMYLPKRPPVSMARFAADAIVPHEEEDDESAALAIANGFAHAEMRSP